MEELIVPGTLEMLVKLRDYVADAARKAELGRISTHRLKLAVDEIATNAIMYGYDADNRKGDIGIKAELNDEALTIILEDTGPAFDPTVSAPDVDLDTAIEDRPSGGLGIFLTLSQVSTFRYERDGDKNRNIFVMKKSEA